MYNILWNDGNISWKIPKVKPNLEKSWHQMPPSGPAGPYTSDQITFMIFKSPNLIQSIWAPHVERLESVLYSWLCEEYCDATRIVITIFKYSIKCYILYMTTSPI